MRPINAERLKLASIRELMEENGSQTGYYFARSNGQAWYRSINAHIPNTTCWYWCAERENDGLRFINEY